MNTSKKIYLIIISSMLIFSTIILMTACSPSSSEGTQTLSLTVSCETVFDNMELISNEKLEILPENGILLDNPSVNFNEGDTAFNILINEMKTQKMHYDTDSTGYIKGIANLYGGDAGEFSGWFYKVNGEFPEVGADSYTPENGDHLEFLYSCDFGKDIGMEY